MEDDSNKPAKLPQYLGATVITIGGFCLGGALAWSSPANIIFGKKFSPDELSWISSILNPGCAIATIVTGFLVDAIGRKWTLILMAVILLIGWLLILLAKSFAMYMAGRFVVGFASGSYSFSSPTYVAEMAHKDIRGQLGIFFQLQLVVGILVGYALGEAYNFMVLNIPFTILPVILIIATLFIPESPMYLYSKGKIEKAEKALKFYRGKNYDIKSEMAEIDAYTKKPDINFWQVATQRATTKGFLMLLVLHMVQQLSGVNAVIFFAGPLFEEMTPLSPGIASIILGIINVIFSIVSAYVVDKFGRRKLWIVSLVIAAISLIMVGVHFQVTPAPAKGKSKSPTKGSATGYMAVSFIYIYLMGFALGAGPLPWLMLGELLPNSMKILCSVVACVNWLMVFAVTRSFQALKDSIGAAIVFWLYAGVCILGLLFVLFVVIETKGKTLDEIQQELSGKKE